MERSIYRTKTIPGEGSTHLRRNIPDVPLVKPKLLKALKILTSSRPAYTNGTDVKPVAVFSHTNELGLKVFRRGISITPVTVYPLQEFRQVAVGGTRTMGGGTSREALRTARRKLKR